MNTTSHCHCGSPTPFSDCCQLIIEGKRPATTAEQLMRSRYSAFCTGNIDYLISSLHPGQRQADDRAQLAATIKQYQWLQLRIIRCQQGGPEHHKGEVEFIASYQQDEKQAQLHENSQFIREQGQWFYVDGQIRPSQQADAGSKPGRNQPCHCGSGRKYKHCHGR